MSEDTDNLWSKIVKPSGRSFIDYLGQSANRKYNLYTELNLGLPNMALLTEDNENVMRFEKTKKIWL